MFVWNKLLPTQSLTLLPVSAPRLTSSEMSRKTYFCKPLPWKSHLKKKKQKNLNIFRYIFPSYCSHTLLLVMCNYSFNIQPVRTHSKLLCAQSNWIKLYLKSTFLTIKMKMRLIIKQWQTNHKELKQNKETKRRSPHKWTRKCIDRPSSWEDMAGHWGASVQKSNISVIHFPVTKMYCTSYIYYFNFVFLFIC